MKTLYTPQLNDPDLVHQLYVKAKAQDVPMTVLTRHLLRDALALPQPPGPTRARARRRRSGKFSLTKRQLAEVTEQVVGASHQLNQFINAFGLLVSIWCRLAKDHNARRQRRSRSAGKPRGG